MTYRFRKISHKEYLSWVNYLCAELKTFLAENNFKVDYVVPVLRSGAVPAVYIANRLNIVKFAPIQVKHVKRKDGAEGINLLLNALECLKITKKSPVFLVVEGSQSSGGSVALVIDEILKKYKNAKILYVCLVKNYNSQSFKDKVIFEAAAHLKGNSSESIEECENLNVDPYIPVYPWETMNDRKGFEDDKEENIFFW